MVVGIEEEKVVIVICRAERFEEVCDVLFFLQGFVLVAVAVNGGVIADDAFTQENSLSLLASVFCCKIR